jgi:hypothetical protein
MAGIMGSNEFFQRAAGQSASGSNDQRFIQALYKDLLNRQASDGEVNAWVGVLQQTDRSNIAMDFLRSAEYRDDVIELYYSQLLHRSSAPAASEVNYWQGTGASLQDIRMGFESSAEFFRNG